jgi:hypothetical protein
MALESLTNEELLKKFNSLFELVNHAIKLAELKILKGQEAHMKEETENLAFEVLEEIEEGRDHLEEIELEAAMSKEEELDGMQQMEELKKNVERRKTRKILTK